MKFTVNRELFIEKLEKANAVVNPKVSIPVLSGVLIDCRQQGFVLTGSDATETVTVMTWFVGENGSCENDGKAVIPAASIIKVLKKFKKGTVQVMVIHENDALTISESAKKSFTFMTMPFEEYPVFEMNEGKLISTIRREELDLIGRYTLHCTSTSETRPILQGVNLSIEDGQLVCSATDSFRLGLCKFQLRDTTETASTITLSAASLKNALKIMNKEADIELRMLNNTQLMIKGTNVIYYSRLLEGTYPDVSRLIPDSFTSTVKITKTELLDTLEQVSFISNTAVLETSDTFFLKVTPVGNDVAKACLELPCDAEGEMKIKVNVKYLIDSIRTIDDESLQINFSNAKPPFTIQGVDDTYSSNLQLILPIRM